MNKKFTMLLSNTDTEEIEKIRAVSGGTISDVIRRGIKLLKLVIELKKGERLAIISPNGEIKERILIL